MYEGDSALLLIQPDVSYLEWLGVLSIFYERKEIVKGGGKWLIKTYILGSVPKAFIGAR